MGELQWIRECDWLQRPRSTDVIVWIDVQRFDALWRLGPAHLYISRDAAPQTPKFMKFASWIADQAEPIIMPHIGSVGGWGFSNGRHRFCWFRHNGLAALPVTTDEEVAAELERVAGANRTIS